MPLSAAERHQRVSLALAAVGLTDRAEHLPKQLSGGQEQRVAIARAIVADPPLLVADEPTGNLDHDSATGVLTLLDRLNRERGKTILMVTHDPRAAEHGTRRFTLDKGELRELAPGVLR
jgi:putative ABC transport system ATP-binding protein